MLCSFAAAAFGGDCMATSMEMQANQKSKLFMLLSIKSEKKERLDETVDKFIDQVTAEMTQEDVAWVEKIVRKNNTEAKK